MLPSNGPLIIYAILISKFGFVYVLLSLHSLLASAVYGIAGTVAIHLPQYASQHADELIMSRL